MKQLLASSASKHNTHARLRHSQPLVTTSWMPNTSIAHVCTSAHTALPLHQTHTHTTAAVLTANICMPAPSTGCASSVAHQIAMCTLAQQSDSLLDLTQPTHTPGASLSVHLEGPGRPGPLACCIVDCNQYAHSATHPTASGQALTHMHHTLVLMSDTGCFGS